VGFLTTEIGVGLANRRRGQIGNSFYSVKNSPGIAVGGGDISLRIISGGLGAIASNAYGAGDRTM